MRIFYCVLGWALLGMGFHHGPDQHYYLTVSCICTTASAIIYRLDKLKPLSR